jgi:hypothetical protein
MPVVELALSADGPILDVYFGVSGPRFQALAQAKQPPPLSFPVRSLIDTGASCTALDRSILQQLGIPPSGSVPIHTPSTSGNPITVDQYDVSMAIPHPPTAVNPQIGIQLIDFTLPVIGTDFTGQNIKALIGRDILARCLLVYSGLRSGFTIAF